jgi:hypothetical protein
MMKVLLTSFFLVIFSSQVMAEADFDGLEDQKSIKNRKKRLSIFEEWKSFRGSIPPVEVEHIAQEDSSYRRNAIKNGILGPSMTLFSFDGKYFDFHPKMSSDVYQSILNFNELSYLKAKIDSRESKLKKYYDKKFSHLYANQGYSDEKNLTQKIDIIKRKIENFKMMSKNMEEEYSKKGWDGFIPIEGKTGKANQGRDIPCVISYRLKDPVIIIAFHGSQTGSVFPNKSDDRTDWGSNRDFYPVRAHDFLPDIDPSVLVHRGIATNLSSVQDQIHETFIRLLGQHDALRKALVIFTGHSKGGGMASLSAPIFKSFLDRQKKFLDPEFHVASVLFSAPHIFYGKDSKLWVSKTLGEANVLRIQVAGDPVPHILHEALGYQSIGWLIEDSMKNVQIRSQKKSEFHAFLPAFFYQESHYLTAQKGQKRNFAPHLVVQYDEILDNFGSKKNFKNFAKNEEKTALE